MPSPWTFEPAQFLSFRDAAVCDRVRRIRKSDLCKHPNANFRIRIIEDPAYLYFQFALHMARGIRRALEEGRRHVIILPAPWPEYRLVADLINAMRIDCKHVHTFNMDEWANEDGKTAPRTWKGGFQYWMWNDLFSR